MHANDRKVTEFTTLGHALFHTYELSIPLFIGIWMKQFGLSAFAIGTVVGAGYALVGIGAPLGGVLSDYFGSRGLIIVSILGMGAGFALLSLAWGIASLTMGVLLWGAFASLYHPAGLSLISRVAVERGTVFAYHGAGGNVGTALGPLVTVFFLSVTDWRTTAVLLFVPAAVASVIGFRIAFESDERAETKPRSLAALVRDAARNSRALFTFGFVIVFVAVVLYGTYYRGLLTFLPDVLGESPWLTRVELFDRSLSPAEYVYSGMLTVGIVGQYVGGKVTDRIPSKTAFLGSLLVLVVLALAFVPAWNAGILPIIVVSLALGFFVYGTAPIYQVVIAEQTADSVHGLTYGYTYLAMFGIGAVGAGVAGTVLTYATIASLFTVLAAVAAIGSVCVFVLRRF